ncbi:MULTISPECIES: hypothetical protein [Porphyromonadaceae]|uniref:hypothetical protein n=1 Tax=Porphyromonadaceae TaxID=171551 RepID=UPI000D9B3FA5|nr:MULTISPECIES: hypothetical protein [Porphyromonadaceae]MCR9011950.1 hypothetical protein [Gabonibacter chumensis]PXZ44905.1 hypothetical protein DMB45_00205 [Sanguibacteroides justesenii]
MTPNINIYNLVRQLLPPHKRQIVRLTLLRSFLNPLKYLFDDFYKWRDNTRMMLNVNSQVKIFEGYLRKKYNQPIAIKIITFADGLLLVGLEREGITMMPQIGNQYEFFTSIPLTGEIREQFGNADFIVYIPPEVDINLVQAEIENYKQALVKYKIIQN